METITSNFFPNSLFLKITSWLMFFYSNSMTNFLFFFFSVRSDSGNVSMHQQSRLSTISFWFSQMSETLQAVALVTLFRRTTPKISKFLAIILESALSDETELEASIMEANNLGKDFRKFCLVQ